MLLRILARERATPSATEGLKMTNMNMCTSLSACPVLCGGFGLTPLLYSKSADAPTFSLLLRE